mmetsp:Transcript_3784/g.10435  ORF Transcript_3784/g.10435 Transcript_3784/m.10435 type:complete len:211 (-) Transcript_3784:1404-2036(-)
MSQSPNDRLASGSSANAVSRRQSTAYVPSSDVSSSSSSFGPSCTFADCATPPCTRLGPQQMAVTATMAVATIRQLYMLFSSVRICGRTSRRRRPRRARPPHSLSQRSVCVSRIVDASLNCFTNISHMRNCSRNEYRGFSPGCPLATSAASAVSLCACSAVAAASIRFKLSTSPASGSFFAQNSLSASVTPSPRMGVVFLSTYSMITNSVS